MKDLPWFFVNMLRLSEGLGESKVPTPPKLSASIFTEDKKRSDPTIPKSLHTFKGEGDPFTMSVGDGARSPHLQTMHTE